MRKLEFVLLAFILIGAFVVRLYQFNNPILEWHSWRQADTSSVSRQFVKEGFDIFHPTFHDLSQGVSLIDNPKGHRFVEFPIYNVLQAGFYKFFGFFSLEEWGRLVTILSQLISVVFVYLILSHYTSKRAGLFGAAFFSFIPFNIFYGRVVLPDSSTVSAILASIYFFSQWTEKPQKSLIFVVAVIMTALALLLKPYALFFMIPHVYLAYQKFGIKMITYWKLILFFLLSLIPIILWRLWMLQYPEGIPQSNWLFNGDGIRFKGAFFHWIFADRIAKLILGYFGLPFVMLGILAKTKKEGFLYLSFLVSSLAYITIMAKGNVQHDYYQILIIPTLALLFGKGIDFIFNNTKDLFNKYISYAVIMISCLFMIAFGWFYIRDFYTLQHMEIIQIGKKIDSHLPKDAKVIAPFGGDTTFLYQINRSGWPVFDRSIAEFIRGGADYIAFVSPTPAEMEFKKYFAVALEGKSFIVFDLHKPTSEGRKLIESQ